MTAQRGPRPIYLTPFGLYTRYMLGSYLRHTVMVAAALMTVALTIDLWPQVALFSGDPLVVAVGVMRLAMLRLPDLLPPFVPFAAFLGVVWSESAFTESRERLLIWNSGRSPLFCLMPALCAGLVLGAVLYVVDVVARPAAIHVQMAEWLGREGIRLDRSQSGGAHWVALPDGLLRAEIEYGPPLRLHNVTIYRLDNEGHLAEVNRAALAQPMGQGLWRLTQGRYWRANAAERGDVVSTAGNGQEKETPFQSRTIAMNLNDLWLRNLGLSPQYLYAEDLRALAGAPIMSRDLFGYQTRLHLDYGEVLFTVAMALMGAALSLHYFAYATRWFALVTVLPIGYLAHFASKAFILMGEFGYIAPFWAGWLAPMLLLAGLARVMLVLQKKRGLGARLGNTPHFNA